MNEKVGLDFETYSGVNLKVHGIARYMEHPTFKVLLAGVAPGPGQAWGLDFVTDPGNVMSLLADAIRGNIVVAHNAPFEAMVLKTLGLADLPLRYEDSAVAARARGGSGSLAHAAQQFTQQQKMSEGVDLIKLFSIPGKLQEENDNLEFDPRIIKQHPAEWGTYLKYCIQDALVGLTLTNQLALPLREQAYADITLDMNMLGWPVDRDVVEEMYARYLENQVAALSEFQQTRGAHDLNLNSFQQQQKWCAERGIKVRSFDEKNVEKLLVQIEKRITVLGSKNPTKVDEYSAVLHMLKTKQVLGGSSLKKLKVILDTITRDEAGVWRLKDQYFHCGAGQSWRTTGRGVQMQNLKRISEPRDMDTLFDPDEVWTNEDLAENIRQCFTSSDPNGALIVGDFSSIESRGLAWQAGEKWKVNAFHNGQDLYKVLASKIYGVPYGDVSKVQRQTGKVGELSCGYGAGPVAVQGFADKMGLAFNDAEAQRLVWDWRDANPVIVEFWKQLDEAMHGALVSTEQTVGLPGDWYYELELVDAPLSLRKQRPGSKTLQVTMTNGSRTLMRRYFHGAHEVGRNIRYFKPSKKKSGALWADSYKDPKTGHIRFYEVYGGKMAGILTQSLCREIFFERLLAVQQSFAGIHNVSLIGQFHDEIVLDWVPMDPKHGNEGMQLHREQAVSRLQSLMSETNLVQGFPMAAEVKFDYRYTK